MKTLQGNFDIEVTGVCGETAISDFAQSGVARMCVHAIALTRRFLSVAESEKMYHKGNFSALLKIVFTFLLLCNIQIIHVQFFEKHFPWYIFLNQLILKIAVFRASYRRELELYFVMFELARQTI